MTSSVPSSTAETQGNAESPHPNRRRDKPQLSCTLCRRRKLKCDRGHPCETCTRRGLSLSCTYVVNKTPEKPDRSTLLRPPPLANVQDRLGQLEKLVMDTLNATKSSTIPEEAVQLTNNLERLSIENTEISYAEGAHWTAILDGIGELKDYFEDNITNSSQESTAQSSDGPQLLLGGFERVSAQDILSDFPPRPVVDRLVAKVLNSLDQATMLIHRPTFLQEYDRFWERPSEAPVMWLGLLFSIMCCGALYQQFSTGESTQPVSLQSSSNPQRIVHNYREKIVQCLVLGNYTKSIPYTIETLLFYFHVEFIRSKDTQSGCWIVLGIILRIALRMGYHRDPSKFPRLSPFQAEMRRRVWLVISQLDVVMSAQIGLPRMIQEAQCDTTEPRNLLDEDMHANMVELPPARPDTFHTTTVYFTAKVRVLSVYGMICDLTTSKKPVPYVEFMRLDKLIDDAYQGIPQWLQMRSMSKSIMDDPETIVRRSYLALGFHKSKCTLHLRYMLPARTDSRYKYSRKTCIDNALKILELQTVLDQETHLDGRLHHHQWKITAVMQTEFLFATTVLCLYLDQGQGSPVESSAEESETNQKIFTTLNDSYLIWLRSSDSSREAQKAAQALRIVLGNAELSGARISSQALQYNAIPTSSPSNPSFSHLVHDGVDMTSNRNWPLNFSDIAFDNFDFNNWDAGNQELHLDDLLDATQSFPI